MKYVYSAASNSFYPLTLKESYEDAGEWPVDGVEVDDTVFSEFQNPPPGKIRIAGENGFPSWADIPPATREELIDAAEQERQKLLAHADTVMLDWRTELMLGEISDANRAKLSAWLAYKNEVKSVDVTTDPEHVNWPVPPEG
ncbi:tail fiber assembly protein [Salmonella enterica]|nr:tail fiber assembly protein [Salmonella enterica]EKB5473661.1 tail fiber assembly protein [Salmonella enterica]EKC2613580.1 tail fiber assembly protein [Salmonella enterica]EKC2691915.1 tail fiber assembly protein [Salmonella enterica]ELL0513636.1 tail fiber assembly protein [Salmonella enterica]